MEHLNKKYLLSNRQYEFRKNRSAADLQLLMTADWTAPLDRSQRTCALALNIERAFDRVWNLDLLEKLKCYGVDSNLLELLKHYLHGRQMRVVFTGNRNCGNRLRQKANLQEPHRKPCKKSFAETRILQEDQLAA
nr:uncharacterized protein LOC113818135 [Penaeus vannamei]